MIFIPSHKRADICKTAKMLSQATICCLKSEVAEYRKHNRNQIVAIPESYGGRGMSVIRNWILKNSPTDEVLMIDDDLNGIGYFETCRGDTFKVKMDEPQIYGFIEQAFRMCREAGTILWGLNLLDDKKAYREYSPLSLTSVILGPFMGIIRDGDVRFDDDLGLKEDFDFSIQVLNKYRKILRFNKYHYIADHLVGRGGCTVHRTRAAEAEQRERFTKKWGTGIVRFKGNDVNPVVRVPIAGI